MNRRQFLATVTGASLGVASGIACASRANPRRWAAVRSLIEAYVANRKLAGVAVALSYNNAPISYLRVGRIAVDSPVPFDEDSLSRIYSMTKPVTGIAAMILIDDGMLALDQPVAEILSELRSLRVGINIPKNLESRPAQRTMTMRHLLTHTSGLGYWTPDSGTGPISTAYRERGITPGNIGSRLNRPGYGPQARNLTEMIERVAELPLLFEPGTAWSYSIGLDAMGLVIERVTGKGFDEFLRERLFEPLGMSSTSFQVAQRDLARLTTNYEATAEGLKATDDRRTSAWLHPPTLLAGGAGLISSARDFARFGAMLLGDGAAGRVRILKPKTARLARSNLLPAGVRYAGGGFGAGGLVVESGGYTHLAPPGSFGFGGAAGTFWFIDPARGGNRVFMAQHMPPHPAAIREEVAAAIESDLKQHHL